jgi:hypothetical protein
MEIIVDGITYKAKDVRLGTLAQAEVYQQKYREAWDAFTKSGDEKDFEQADAFWLKRVVLFLEGDAPKYAKLSLNKLPLSLESEAVLKEKQVKRNAIIKQIEELQSAAAIELLAIKDDATAYEKLLNEKKEELETIREQSKECEIKTSQQELESFFSKLVEATRGG